jgi:hypothetical protein
MVDVLLSFLLSLTVPDDNTLIIATRGHKTHILREDCTSDPILMPIERKLEPAVIDTPDFNSLIITGADKQLAVTRELNSPDWSTMSFN